MGKVLDTTVNLKVLSEFYWYTFVCARRNLVHAIGFVINMGTEIVTET